MLSYRMGISSFRWIALLMTLHSFGLTEAYLCMCSPNSCVLVHPNTEFFEHADAHCSSFRTVAQDVSIIKLMDKKLSSEAFKKFPNMNSMEIFQGHLENIDSSTFSGAGKLTKLLIRGSSIEKLDDYSFKGADQLKELLISSNPLTEVSEKTIANLEQLEILVLSYGSLSTLPSAFFQNNRKLRIVSLNNNKITELSAEVFRGLDQLGKLELAGNQLKTFDSTYLKASVIVMSNNSLEHLVINEHCSSMYAGHNKIQTVTVEGSGLLKLFLNNNNIKDIGNLTKLRNLTTLSLGHNELDPNTSFSSFIAVEELMLQSTNINISYQTFRNLTNLKILDLSYNNLTSVDFKMFGSQLSLHVVSFVGNKIKSFNYIEAREYLPSLRVLEICNNGWNTTYFEQNIAKMKRFSISPDSHGFSSDFLFRHDYIHMCAEHIISEYSDYDYQFPPSLGEMDATNEEDINEQYTSTSTTSTTTTTTPVPKTTERQALTSTERSNIVPATSERHHVIEHDSKIVDNVQPAEQTSALYVTFQILVYILSVVGLVSLIALAYFWRRRQMDVRSLSSMQRNEEASDAVLLI
ncbi:leucine-rich repeat-containing G-protein coupled receptor 4-like [Uranotaenia lowii]|uniref:leucine-rich repeat-containing G-protein coupled receptor 4-like n=1 Tax=Uranotaenia lowii TaxID=190385 RepID=UPI002478A985|nr:leucine-rich repeat-containing G-protein coupled receptor 4-like [Uranotaenia lowii]